MDKIYAVCFHDGDGNNFHYSFWKTEKAAINQAVKQNMGKPPLTDEQRWEGETGYFVTVETLRD